MLSVWLDHDDDDNDDEEEEVASVAILSRNDGKTAETYAKSRFA